MAECPVGNANGFTGMMVVRPCQVPLIHDTFTPTDEAVRHARAVVAAFAANPGAGVLDLGVGWLTRRI